MYKNAYIQTLIKNCAYLIDNTDISKGKFEV